MAWNVTGSILSSAGDDGKIRLWRKAANGRWMVISIINHTDGDEALDETSGAHHQTGIGHHGGSHGLSAGGGGMFAGGLQGGSVQTVPEEDE